MEIANLVTNAQQDLHLKVENSHQTKLTDTNVSETKKSGQQNIDKQVSEEKKVFDEKEVKKKIEEVTEELNKEMDILNTTIRFHFDDKTDEIYVTVIDTKDNRVIRQIPSEEAMKLAAKMRELVGMLFDERG